MYMRYFGILQEVKYNSNTRINRIPRYIDKHNEENYLLYRNLNLSIISANNNGPPQKVGKSVMLHSMYFICAVNLQNIISTQNCVLSIRISSIETACFG